jgi:hypothetical protein
MKEISEDYIQNQIVIWFTNNYCLPKHNPRWIIFSVPNGGLRNKKEAKRLKDTGLLPGVSDLIVVGPNQTVFFEVKRPGKTQSPEQIDFQSRVEALGFKYILVRSLEDFKINLVI